MPKSKKVERLMGRLFDTYRVDKIVRINKVISENTLDKSSQAWRNKHLFFSTKPKDLESVIKRKDEENVWF